MGCGCSKAGSVCGGDKTKLKSLRNRIVTLYNTSKDAEKRREYKEVRTGVDEVIKSSACPDKKFLAYIKNYVDSEYNKLH